MMMLMSSRGQDIRRVSGENDEFSFTTTTTKISDYKLKRRIEKLKNIPGNLCVLLCSSFDRIYVNCNTFIVALLMICFIVLVRRLRSVVPALCCAPSVLRVR